MEDVEPVLLVLDVEFPDEFVLFDWYAAAYFSLMSA